MLGGDLVVGCGPTTIRGAHRAQWLSLMTLGTAGPTQSHLKRRQLGPLVAPSIERLPLAAKHRACSVKARIRFLIMAAWPTDGISAGSNSKG